MAKYKPGETPPEEFDEVADRVSTNVKFSEDTFTIEKLVNQIHKKYELNPNKEHEIYDVIGEHLRSTIQEKISDYIEKEHPKEEWLAPEQEEELVRVAKGAYSKKKKDKILEEMWNLPAIKKLLPKIESETEAEPEDVKEAFTFPTDIKKEMDLTLQLAEKSDRPSFVGKIRAQDLYDDVLRYIKKHPGTTFKKTAEDLQKKGYFTEMKPDTLRRRIGGLNLRGKDYVESYPRFGYVKLTKKGEEILKKLKND